MDPEDDSITGIAKYLIYRKRKEIEFYKDSILVQYGSREGLDPSDALKKMMEMMFPEDPKERMIKDIFENKLIIEESQKELFITANKNGVLSLKIK